MVKTKSSSSTPTLYFCPLVYEGEFESSEKPTAPKSSDLGEAHSSRFMEFSNVMDKPLQVTSENLEEKRAGFMEQL